MADTFTYERAASELSDAMDAAIKRLETIQETHPDIALDDDLPRYREAQAQFRRIPSLSQREKQWNTRSDQSARIAELEADNARLSDALDTERYKVAIGIQAVAKAVQGRKWLSEPGRGSYAYDDERYQAEFAAALNEIDEALKPLRAVAADWSGCPRDPLRVSANREAARTALQKEDRNDG